MKNYDLFVVPFRDYYPNKHPEYKSLDGETFDDSRLYEGLKDKNGYFTPSFSFSLGAGDNTSTKYMKRSTNWCIFKYAHILSSFYNSQIIYGYNAHPHISSLLFTPNPEKSNTAKYIVHHINSVFDKIGFDTITENKTANFLNSVFRGFLGMDYNPFIKLGKNSSENTIQLQITKRNKFELVKSMGTYLNNQKLLMDILDILIPNIYKYLLATPTPNIDGYDKLYHKSILFIYENLKQVNFHYKNSYEIYDYIHKNFYDVYDRFYDSGFHYGGNKRLVVKNYVSNIGLTTPNIKTSIYKYFLEYNKEYLKSCNNVFVIANNKSNKNMYSAKNFENDYRVFTFIPKIDTNTKSIRYCLFGKDTNDIKLAKETSKNDAIRCSKDDYPYTFLFKSHNEIEAGIKHKVNFEHVPTDKETLTHILEEHLV